MYILDSYLVKLIPYKRVKTYGEILAFLSALSDFTVPNLILICTRISKILDFKCKITI